jgi:hypothetical protein
MSKTFTMPLAKPVGTNFFRFISDCRKLLRRLKMASKALIGKYKAVVTSVSLGGIGKNETPAIEVVFKPTAELVGADWREGQYTQVKKPYWLSDKVIASGKSAGKTSIELTRDQIKETYGYEGGLDEEQLRAGLVGKEVEIVCKAQDAEEKYTEVEFVNPPGGSRKGFKKLNPVNVDKLVVLASLWSGKPKEEKQMDATELFKNMTQGAA